MPYLQRDAEQEMMDDRCVFCHKANCQDDRAEHILARSTHVYATLNLYPYNNGHLMIIPYEHVASPEELSSKALLDLMCVANQAMAVLREVYNPQAFNMGANIGAAAGAGIAEHFHLHIVPRWSGDTNYMTVIAKTRVIPDWIDDTYEKLYGIWARRFPAK